MWRLSLQYGHFYYNADYLAHADGAVSTMDTITKVIGGDSTTGRTFIWNKRHHTNGTVSCFKSNGAPRQPRDQGRIRLHGGARDSRRQREGSRAIISCVFRSGAPFEINAFNTPNSPRNAGWYFGTYVSDNLTIGRRLTLNVGARYAYQPVWVPAQCGARRHVCRRTLPRSGHPVQDVQLGGPPRLSVALDLDRQGARRC